MARKGPRVKIPDNATTLKGAHNMLAGGDLRASAKASKLLQAFALQHGNEKAKTIACIARNSSSLSKRKTVLERDVQAQLKC